MPGCEKNKGSILARAVQYINDLKSRDAQGDQRRTYEKSVLEQCVEQLQSVIKELRADLRGAVEERDSAKARLAECRCGAAEKGGGGGGENQSGESTQ